MQTRNLLAAMVSLEVLWLVMRWLLMATPNWSQLLPLFVYTLVLGLAIGLMPASFVSKIRQLKEGLIQNEKLLILTLCVVVLTVGVVYANYRPVYADEVQVFDASRMVAEEGVVPFFAEYARIPWLGPQHPPLVPLIYGFALRVLGVSLFVIRLVSLVFGTTTILLTYFLGSELYDRGSGLLAAFLLLSSPLFLLVSAAAVTDMLVAFLFSLVLLLSLRLLRRPTYQLSVAAGVFIGLGLLSKYTMVLIYLVLLSYFVTNASFRRLKLHLGIVTLVSVGMLAPWLVYAYRSGVLVTQRHNITSYVGVVTTTDFGKRFMLEWLLTGLPSNLGPYNIPILLLGGLHLMRRRNRADLFLLLWIVTVFLPVALTLPDQRYFLPAFPALAIMMARGLARIPEAAEQAVVLALLYCGEALYLYVVLNQVARLFLR
jgi:4-amino-4-deoxy-L-arabinose transferase-like glycosyltransferase